MTLSDSWYCSSSYRICGDHFTFEKGLLYDIMRCYYYYIAKPIFIIYKFCEYFGVVKFFSVLRLHSSCCKDYVKTSFLNFSDCLWDSLELISSSSYHKGYICPLNAQGYLQLQLVKQFLMSFIARNLNVSIVCYWRDSSGNVYFKFRIVDGPNFFHKSTEWIYMIRFISDIIPGP